MQFSTSISLPSFFSESGGKPSLAVNLPRFLSAKEKTYNGLALPEKGTLRFNSIFIKSPRTEVAVYDNGSGLAGFFLFLTNADI